MKTLGLDLSLTHTGVCTIEDGKLIESWSIKSKPVGPKPADELKRLQTIVDTISERGVVAQSHDMVVIEGLAFMARNTTALVQLAGLNYMVRAMLAYMGAPFVIVAPSSLKKFITGKGNGDKNIMLMEVYKQYGHTFLDDNECDAFCLALIGQAVVDNKMKLTVPQKEVAELVKTQL